MVGQLVKCVILGLITSVIITSVCVCVLPMLLNLSPRHSRFGWKEMLQVKCCFTFITKIVMDK